MSKKCIISGLTGMDGSNLAELLLLEGYEVIGIVRRSATCNTSNITQLLNHPNLSTVFGDITDATSVREIVEQSRPDYFYNLACQSHVQISYKNPSYTFQSVALGALNVLEAIRSVNPSIRMYQASSSEQFGNNIDEDGFQRETTPFKARSPYAVGKVAAHQLCFTYRESYGIHASCGILFNHSGPRRGINFVEKKISNYVARLRDFNANGDYRHTEFPKLALGNLDSCRDIGASTDYVKAQKLIIESELPPDDYVIATGETHSIKEILQLAFAHIAENWEDWVYQDPQFMRPAEVINLRGDATKAKKILGWSAKTSFSELIRQMIDEDRG